MKIKPARIGNLALGAVFFLLIAAAGRADILPFEPGDTLEEIRYKIDYNGYDFTVEENRIFNLPAEEKTSFFSRHLPLSPRRRAVSDEIGPLAEHLGQTLPSVFDWRDYGGRSYIGPVRDQGNCGSCYAFGATAAAEGTYNWAAGRYDANRADFSEAFIAFCLDDHYSGFSGCEGSDYDFDELQALVDYGICDESAYPYRDSSQSCPFGSYPALTGFQSWHRIPCNDIEAIKTAIMTYGVVDAAVYVGSAFQAYGSGVYQDSNTSCSSSPCYYTPTNHAIALVGWDDNPPEGGGGVWILRNSWGNSWGEDGYMRIRYTSARVACEACYLVYESSAGPTPTPRPVISTPTPPPVVSTPTPITAPTVSPIVPAPTAPPDPPEPTPAASLMPLPPFNTTYSSTYTRGLWFTAPTDFVITGLRVPNENGQSIQNLEVVRFTAGPPPTYPNTTSNIVSLARLVDQSAGDVLPVNIPVSSGDIIGVLGACGTSTMFNSYAAYSTYTSYIRGFPVTIARLGMQFNLNTTRAGYLFTSSGSISRVEIYYSGDIVATPPPPPPVELCAALDNCVLGWTRGGDGDWYGQAGVTHDGVDAAQSAVITDSQDTWFETEVAGPGELGFWWRVSSENYYDYLEFYIDGVRQVRISGESAWQERTYSLGSGAHTLKWRYMKDWSVAEGSDCGWVDQVTWTGGIIQPSPTPTPPPPPGTIEVADSILPEDDHRMPFGGVVIGASRTEQITVSNTHPTNDLLVEGIALTGRRLSSSSAVPESGDEITDPEARKGQTQFPLKSDSIPDQILVGFRPEVKTSSRQSLHANLGGVRLHAYRRIPVEVVQLPQGSDLESLIAAYEARPEVAYAEPNYEWRAISVPDDPRFEGLWGLQNTGQTGGTEDADIDAPEAWDITTGSREVIVAVIDTGIDYNHPDLAGNMWVNPSPAFGDIHGARWTSGNGTVTSGDPMDGHGHGTHCAGTIGAVGDNGIGVAGINWNVRLMALKFLSDSGSGSSADAVSAIEYAIEKGAYLSSNSWGGGGYSQALKDMIDAAGRANQLFIAAAGNSGSNNDTLPHYPSSYTSENIVAVASCDHNDQRSSFSCYGSTSVDLAAPGSSILSTWKDGGYNTISGTSMATPHVAGVAALILSLNPGFSQQEVKGCLLEGVDPQPAWTGRTVTEGRLNAAASLELANPDFHLANVPDLPATIEPGRDLTFDVVYEPVSAGEHQNTLRIESNDGTNPAVDVALGGSAIANPTPPPPAATPPPPPAITLCAALDNCGLDWATGGDGDWYGQAGVNHDGVDAARSAAIADGQETWFETEVAGPGELGFWWMVSSETYYDYLEFYIDGYRRDRVSGAAVWQEKTYSLTAGAHTLRWRYVKDYSVSSGSDCGWVDQVTWSADDVSTTPPPSSTPTATPEGYQTPPPTPTPVARPWIFDYDGDGVSDIGVYRPASGLWAIRGVTRAYWGRPGDEPVPGDYDGDGTTDIGNYRPAAGHWFVRGQTGIFWGRPGDIPVPGDYRADGTTDIGVYRSASGLWAIRGVTRAYWGRGGDEPVPGDYNGDGVIEIGAYRPATGYWFIRNLTRVFWGRPGDALPVPGDYNADGTTDIGVYRPASGLWAIRDVTRAYWGRVGDTPVPGGYWRGPTTEIGAYRPVTGYWFIRDLTRVFWGRPGDVPVTR